MNETEELFPPEQAILPYVEWLRLIIEVVGVLVIALGIIQAVVLFVRNLYADRNTDFHEVRLLLARYLALALEFQLASDVISTAIAPTWERIGKLAAIAVIRTGLNYFLMRELEHAKKDEP